MPYGIVRFKLTAEASCAHVTLTTPTGLGVSYWTKGRWIVTGLELDTELGSVIGLGLAIGVESAKGLGLAMELWLAIGLE